MEDKMKIARLLLFAGILMVVVGGGMFFMEKDKFFKKASATPATTTDNGGGTEVAPQASDTINIIDYNGVYEKDGNVIKFYGLNNVANVQMVSDVLNASNKVEVIDNVFTINNFCTVNLIQSVLNVQCSEPYSQASGIYNKTLKYDALDFYTDNIGNPNFVNTKFFGEYSLDAVKITMYQTDETEAFVSFSGMKDDISVNNIFTFTITEEGALHLEENGSTIDIVINDNETATVTATDGFANLNGIYNKLRVLTIESVIELKLA